MTESKEKTVSEIAARYVQKSVGDAVKEKPKKRVPPRGPAKTFPPWKDPHLFIQDKYKFALEEIDRLNGQLDKAAEKYNAIATPPPPEDFGDIGE
jgi:hypothetical protein